MSVTFCFLVLAFAAFNTVTARSQAPSAKVRNGTITGVYSSPYNQDFFLGIPYAQPPVGNLRYRVPQSLNSTFNTTAATAYSPICVGYGSASVGFNQSEDCLTLNVIRPSGNYSKPLPVAVWFHGGGDYMGGSADGRYNLSFIVQNSVAIGKPIIGVSANYRLSALGFLFSTEVAGSGNTNLGLRDQRLALHWLQENLAAFGGDHSKVTIWGESAGAFDVGMHLTAYGGRDDKLFRGAMMESGNPIAYAAFNGTQSYQPLYDQIVEQVGCYNQIDTLQCLRTVPLSQLSNVIMNAPYNTSFQATVDGDFIEKDTSIQLADGEFVHVPIISGFNTDDGTLFAPYGINDDAGFLHWLENTTQATGIALKPFLAEEMAAAYPNNPADGIPAEVSSVPAALGLQYRRVAEYTGDAMFIAPRRLTCETWARAGLQAYSYRFNAIPAGIPYFLGVTHVTEVAFVFYNLNGDGFGPAQGTVPPFLGKPPSYAALAHLMTSSWTSFVYDLDPNSFRATNLNISGNTTRWPAYSVQNPMNYVFDANVSSYAEADTFRATGISLINSAMIAYRR